MIRFMGANADTYKLALTYFQIVAAGLVFQAISMGVTACLRGVGETKIPMLYNVVSNLLNVFGNYALIYGKFGMPRLEVAGAALSTTIACALAFLASLYVLFVWRKSKLSMKPNLKFRFDWSVVGQVFKIGIPAAGEQFVIQGGLMFFVRIVAGVGHKCLCCPPDWPQHQRSDFRSFHGLWRCGHSAGRPESWCRQRKAR